MALSEDVRNELAAIAPRRECDKLAELSALFHTAGSIHLRGRGEDLETLAAVERVMSSMRTETGTHIPDGVPQALASYAAQATDPRVGEAAETIEAIEVARTHHEYEGDYEQL